MKLHTHQVILALTVLASLGHAGGASDQNSLPFELVGSGQSVPGQSGMVTFTGTGVATHLGQLDIAGVVQRLSVTPQFITFQGNVVFTAANGDQLNAVIEDGVRDRATGIATSIYRFTGGTGRFQNASGSTNGRSENPPGGSFMLVLEGTISY